MLVLASQANAQSVSGRAPAAAVGVGSGVGSGAMGGAETVAGQVATGTGPSGSQSFSGELSTGSVIGGNLPATLGSMKFGDKVINLHGSIGVENDRPGFAAGVGLPF